MASPLERHEGARRPQVEVEITCAADVAARSWGHFDLPGMELHGGMLRSKALDNLLSCVLILATMARLRRRMAPRAATTLVLLAGLLPAACFPPGEGIAPPGRDIYFPVGLSVDEQRNFLFIVNSDFDLQYNAGTVQSWCFPPARGWRASCPLK